MDAHSARALATGKRNAGIAPVSTPPGSWASSKIVLSWPRRARSCAQPMPVAPAPMIATRLPERGARKAVSGVWPTRPETERESCALVQGSGEGRVDGVEKPLA